MTPISAKEAARQAGATSPLHGLRVIDMTAVISGPFATQTLGELGADVIKIEPPGGDGQRRIGPSRAPTMGPIYINSNRAKRSVVLDLKSPHGIEVLLRLAEQADVLMTNFRASAMHRLGLSYERLSEINPKLVYVGISGFAEGGPYSDRPAYDDLIQAGSTLASMVALKSGNAPQYVPLAIADRVTGLNAAIAVMAAVIERSSSGKGQQVNVPMYEALLSFVLADHLGGLSFEPPLDGGGYPRLLARGRKPYATKDGYIAAMMFTDKQWRSFYRLLGREMEFDADPRMNDLSTRNKHIDELYSEVEEAISTRTTAFWLEELERADIPVMPLHDMRTVFSDPHLKSTGFFETEQHPSEGTLRRMRHPMRWSRTQPPPPRHAPRPGEHTVEVLQQVGFTSEEVADLIASGVATASSIESL